MHSLLSRTEFQHLSGACAALEFVETPSYLFEYFAWDFRVVCEFATHYQTNASLPATMMQGLQSSQSMFVAMDTQTQCLYSMLELELCKDQPLPCRPPTITQMLHELQRSSTIIPPVLGTYWHTRFGHLIGYGAGYYSYLYARVCSADIWRTIVNGAQVPLSYEEGNTLFQLLMVQQDPFYARIESRLAQERTAASSKSISLVTQRHTNYKEQQSRDNNPPRLK
ncbi:hypothetical protein PsorP6_011422 [Peronosclerospora sorghi]|uniref:Uncharacterized protein n=1 Tax=Peronosclerospora sorghi TaxID=230839 RepID=A0ACC0WLQ6_9STRA|nr:hypothetical protein PsorP6_011422 [Peronosclerospora sorghi]